MSTTDLPGPKLSWYSVSIRYFAPMIATRCFIASLSVFAESPEDAIRKGSALFYQEFYDKEAKKYFLPGGVEIELWWIDALEMPPERAALFEKEYFGPKEAPKSAPATPGGPGNVIELFPKKDPPPGPGPKPDNGGNDTPPGGPSGEDKK